MALEHEEVAERFNTETALTLLKKLREPVDYELVAPNPSLLNAALQRIPWLSNFLQDVEDTSAAIIKIGEHVIELPDAPSNQALGNMFHFGSVALAAFDFVRIPIIYVAAYILNQKVPINLDNNARWFYSGVLLALIIISLTVPVTAPIISFIVAGIGVAVSLFLLGRTLYERYQLGRERRKIKNMLEEEHDDMDSIQEQALFLENLLTDATEESQILAIYQEIAVLQERYDVQKAHLEDLKTLARDTDQKIKEVGIMRVVDKSISITLGSVTIIGLILTLYIPPIGLLFISTTAVVGSVYVLGRIMVPLLKAFGSWLMNKILPPATKNNSAEETITKDNKLTLDSTTEVLLGLKGKVVSEPETKEPRSSLSIFSKIKLAPSVLNKEKNQDEKDEYETVIDSKHPENL